MKVTKGPWITVLIMLIVSSCSSRVNTTREATPMMETTTAPQTLAETTHTYPTKRSMVRPPVSYFKESKPPCIYDDITKWDTCSADPPTYVEMISVEAMGPMWPIEGGIPTLTEIMLGQGATLASVHLVIRGVVQKNTTRCGAYPIKIPNYMNETSLFWKLYHYHCFADIDVSEYIVGTGPAIITVSLHQETISEDYLDKNQEVMEEIVSSILEDPEYRTATAYEGKELILLLIPTTSIAVEGWQTAGEFAMWFVQRVDKDKIQVVSQDIIYAETDEQRNQLTRPLEEFIEQIKQANIERNNITDGKVGTYPATLPSIVTDANFLQNYYISVGAVYDETDESTVLPPPVPGEDDLAPPTIPINDEKTETILIPGEEPTTPLPTDDAGTSTTTTTTTTITEETTTTGTETTTTSAPTTTIVETDTTTSIPTTFANTTTTTTEPTTTTEVAVEVTVTGTTTTTTEPSSENDDPTEEQTTTTSTFPSDNENPPTESSLPEEGNNPGPVTPASNDESPSEGNTATVPSEDNSGLSPTDNRDPNDDQTT